MSLAVHKRNQAAEDLLAVGDMRPETPSAQGAFLLQARARYRPPIAAPL